MILTEAQKKDLKAYSLKRQNQVAHLESLLRKKRLLEIDIAALRKRIASYEKKTVSSLKEMGYSIEQMPDGNFLVDTLFDASSEINGFCEDWNKLNPILEHLED